MTESEVAIDAGGGRQDVGIFVRNFNALKPLQFITIYKGDSCSRYRRASLGVDYLAFDYSLDGLLREGVLRR